jgi:hypothetical protein
MRPRLAAPIVIAALTGASPLVHAQQAAPSAPVAKPAAVPRAAPAARPAVPSPPAPPRPPARPRASRDGIEALEDRLDDAADRVSAPQLLPALGRASGARGYRLPGYGVVVVLAPRLVPGADVLKVVRPHHRVRAELRRPGDVVIVEAPEAIDAIERQVVLLQHESEQARRAAEETQERIVETVRWRLLSPEEVGPTHVSVEVAPASPAAAAPPDAPEPPAAVPAPPPPPAPAEAPLAPLPPPWKYWFNVEGPHETRTPDALVADVRRALVDALATHPGRLAGLGPEESVTVAVDFETADTLVRISRPVRTLVVRARVRDMEARAAGAIAPDEMRRRLEVVEY